MSASVRRNTMRRVYRRAETHVGLGSMGGTETLEDF